MDRKMGRFAALFLIPFLLLPSLAVGQPGDRIRFNDQDLFLSGGNIAWINFAQDIGPGDTRLDAFMQAFEDVRDNGGNSMRLWLHTNGTRTPEWDGSFVVGPGDGAIEDLRAILDIAWQNNVGLLLCLWSHDMLNIAQNPPEVLGRNGALLRDPNRTQAYIDSALVPMVEALAGHPAIIAWEIFNEPEGISEEHGWSTTRHVPMANIQRFVNQTAGAIHRADPSAQVTNGAWSFISTSDITQEASGKTARDLSAEELEVIRLDLSRKYQTAFTAESAAEFYDGLHSAANFNYYRDDRLIAAGGDPDGTLDFYTVHYYTWAGTELSPFHHPYIAWNLDKPMALGEFFLPANTFGVPADSLYNVLYRTGYAGAFAWQWWDWWVNRVPEQVNWPRARRNMRLIMERYAADVTIDRGLFISRFAAEPPAIEEGQSSELDWVVFGSSEVALNGVLVDSIGSLVVMPAADTTFTLVASDEMGSRDSASVTIEVLDPSQVNRARMRPVVASSGEPGTPQADPNRAVDGDPNTRWGSAWQDDQWIYVDLGDTYELERVILNWEVAYGSAYDLQVSLDGIFWTTAHMEREGGGGVDEIVFPDDGPIARFVRMYGITRATEWGFSLWEFEVYGLESTLKPPVVELLSPYEGLVASPGEAFTVAAEATDPDGEVAEVKFFLGDSLAATVAEPPYEYTATNPPEGSYTISAVAVDNDGLEVSTMPRAAYVTDVSDYSRYEFEEASLEGDILIESTPGQDYVFLRDSGTITFDSVYAVVPGPYLFVIRYNLPFGFKAQYLDVNEAPQVEVAFDGPQEQWQSRGVEVELAEGFNTVVLEKYWGWMYFDYLAVDAPRFVVSAEDETVPNAFVVHPNHPNPFAVSTTLSYELPAPARVVIDLYAIDGRHVYTITDQFRSAGKHSVAISASELAAGVYLYRVRGGDQVRTGRLSVLK